MKRRWRWAAQQPFATLKLPAGSILTISKRFNGFLCTFDANHGPLILSLQSFEFFFLTIRNPPITLICNWLYTNKAVVCISVCWSFHLYFTRVYFTNPATPQYLYNSSAGLDGYHASGLVAYHSVVFRGVLLYVIPLTTTAGGRLVALAVRFSKAALFSNFVWTSLPRLFVGREGTHFVRYTWQDICICHFAQSEHTQNTWRKELAQDNICASNQAKHVSLHSFLVKWFFRVKWFVCSVKW